MKRLLGASGSQSGVTEVIMSISSSFLLAFFHRKDKKKKKKRAKAPS